MIRRRSKTLSYIFNFTVNVSLRCFKWSGQQFFNNLQRLFRGVKTCTTILMAMFSLYTRILLARSGNQEALIWKVISGSVRRENVKETSLCAVVPAYMARHSTHAIRRKRLFFLNLYAIGQSLRERIWWAADFVTKLSESIDQFYF